MIFRNIAAIGTVLVTVCLWTFPGYAQFRSGLPGPRGGTSADGTGIALPLLIRGANLTADQQAQVQQIMANKLFSTARLQEADLAPHIQQISQLRNQLAEEGLRVVLEIRGVLTPQQLEKASQLKSQLDSLHSQMRSIWGPDRPER